MSNWISVDDQLPNYKEEVHVLILLKEDYDWFPKSYAQRVDKAWWLPQRECFVFEDVEDAKHLITHWMPLPESPEDV